MNGIANNYKQYKPIDIAIQGFDRPEEVWLIYSSGEMVYFGYEDKCWEQMINFQNAWMCLYTIREQAEKLNNALHP